MATYFCSDPHAFHGSIMLKKERGQFDPFRGRGHRNADKRAPITPADSE
jgi:hypothetical protein